MFHVILRLVHTRVAKYWTFVRLCSQITGSGRGLGRELALMFAHLGAKLACVDVDATSNEETVKLIESMVPGAVAKAYTVNVAIVSETTALATKVEKELGSVDILINNAAVIVGHTFLGAQDHTISAIININLLGHFWVSRCKPITVTIC